MIDERVSRSLLTVLIRLGEELVKPTKLPLGFPQIIQLLVILAGHGSGQGYEQLFHATTRWLVFCANVLEEKDKPQDDVFHSNILEGSVDLLAYLNDILIALRHLSTANITVESDDDDDESLDDLQSPLFLFERLCHFVLPESANVSTDDQFFLFIEKGGNQEDFLQDRMANNPYPSEDPSMGPLMRDVKKKICQDCELIFSLLEDENGMELLVANKIINLNLSVRDVYKKVWLPSLPPPAAGPPSGTSSEQQAMHVIERMRR